MMTHANAATAVATATAAATAAPDPVAAAEAIAKNARRTDSTEDRPGMAGVIALAAGILLSLGTIGAIAASPAAIPTWCATHACPTVPTLHLT